MKTLDLEGKTFGYFTVIGFSHIENHKAYWNCKCVCGKEVIKQGKLLKNGHITSCGCMHGKKKVIDIAGEKYGSLTVIKYSHTEKNKAYWLCKCDCGNEIIVNGVSLRNGNTKTCGCSRHNACKARLDLTGKTFFNLTVLNYSYTKNKSAIWLCKCKCGNEIEVTTTNLKWGYVRSCRECARHFSEGEKEVAVYIKSIYNREVIENDRSLIAPKEIDIYIPEKHFAIEYNGLYWHSDKIQTSPSYHLQKTKGCLEKGIRLLQIYENEWRDKKDICKSMIASALGIYERKEYARNCLVRIIEDRKTVIDFFDKNHIQGAVHKYTLCLGLYKDEELLQAVVFGKQHFGKNGDYELYRMATKLNTQVLGGFSKLMKHSPYNTVVSYVALRMFDAKGYLAGNWQIEHTANPSFCLTDGFNVFSRHLFKKSECLKKFNNVTKDMTEREMQVKNGFYRLWDSGTYKVRWTRK